MSAPGHCRHCRDGCTLGDTCEFCHVNENWTAAWDDECCPVCDEAERIAQLCDEEAAKEGFLRLPDHDARAQTWQAAANLARGRR